MERWTDRQGYLNKKGVFMRFPILFNCIKYASTRYSNAFMRKTKSYLEGEKDNNAIFEGITIKAKTRIESGCEILMSYNLYCN